MINKIANAEEIQEVLEMVEEFFRNLNTFEDDFDLEDSDMEFYSKGMSFSFVEQKDEEWVSEGKYEYKTYVAELVQLDNIGRPIVETGIYFAQDMTRSGSYFSDYHYQFEVPERVEKKIEIREVVEYRPIAKNK